MPIINIQIESLNKLLKEEFLSSHLSNAINKKVPGLEFLDEMVIQSKEDSKKLSNNKIPDDERKNVKINNSIFDNLPKEDLKKLKEIQKNVDHERKNHFDSISLDQTEQGIKRKEQRGRK